HLDEEPDRRGRRRDLGEDLVEGGHVLGGQSRARSAKAETAQLGGGGVGDGPRAVGGALERRGMNHRARTVARQGHGELERIAAEGDRALEREEAVLRPEGRAAAMRRDPRHFSVSIKPFTNHRCITTITTTGGSSTIMAAAIATFHSGSCEVRGISESIPITAVRLSRRFVTISGPRESFQPYTKRITQSAAMFAFDNGRRNDHRNRSGPAPSSCAASASESGMVWKNCRNRKVPVADAISGTVRPQ